MVAPPLTTVGEVSAREIIVDEAERLRERLTLALERMEAAGLSGSHYRWPTEIPDDIDAELARDALAAYYHDCLHGDDPCPDDARGRSLVALAERVGDMEVVALLVALDARGLWLNSATENVLLRETARTLAPCPPPTASEVETVRATLDDFAVIDRVGNRLVARRPSSTEIDDLAYFLAAVADNGPPVGSVEVGPTPRLPTHEPPSAPRHELYAAASDALARGDLLAAQDAAGGYLRSLGYPGPIDAAAEDTHAWGGARYSYVMRDLARVSEILGEIDVAMDLYRRANPGGGACGTTNDSRRGMQLRGLIRTAERAGQCRAVVAERLLDWEDEYDPPGTGRQRDRRDPTMSYGPGRLAEAGFDLARLYRGAWVTRHRNVEPAVLRKALASAANPLREASLQRLEQRGPEAWEHRVRAVEGLADVQQRQFIPVIVAMLPRLDADLRERAIAALGELTHRPVTGPCDDSVGYGSGRGSNVWHRRVTPLFDTSCREGLDDAEADALARSLLPHLDDTSLDVRTTVLSAIGDMAAVGAVRPLERRRRRLLSRVAACPTPDEHDSANCHEQRYELSVLEQALDTIAFARER